MSERALWAAVLRRAVEDIFNITGAEYREHQAALRWLHTYQSADFRMVCDLAGVDPDAVFGELRQALAHKHAGVGHAA